MLLPEAAHAVSHAIHTAPSAPAHVNAAVNTNDVRISPPSPTLTSGVTVVAYPPDEPPLEPLS